MMDMWRKIWRRDLLTAGIFTAVGFTAMYKGELQYAIPALFVAGAFFFVGCLTYLDGPPR